MAKGKGTKKTGTRKGGNGHPSKPPPTRTKTKK